MQQQMTRNYKDVCLLWGDSEGEKQVLAWPVFSAWFHVLFMELGGPPVLLDTGDGDADGLPTVQEKVSPTENIIRLSFHAFFLFFISMISLLLVKINFLAPSSTFYRWVYEIMFRLPSSRIISLVSEPPETQLGRMAAIAISTERVLQNRSLGKVNWIPRPYDNRWFIAFKVAPHFSLFRASPIQCTFSHFTSFGYILILFSI